MTIILGRSMSLYCLSGLQPGQTICVQVNPIRWRRRSVECTVEEYYRTLHALHDSMNYDRSCAEENRRSIRARALAIHVRLLYMHLYSSRYNRHGHCQAPYTAAGIRYCSLQVLCRLITHQRTSDKLASDRWLKSRCNARALHPPAHARPCLGLVQLQFFLKKNNLVTRFVVIW
jgi:hypothetical protein